MSESVALRGRRGAQGKFVKGLGKKEVQRDYCIVKVYGYKVETNIF